MVFGDISWAPESHQSYSAPPAHRWQGAPPPGGAKQPCPGVSPALPCRMWPIVGRKALGRVETWGWQLLRKLRVVERRVPIASGNPNPLLEDVLSHPEFLSPFPSSFHTQTLR